jgi:hypothetical protein
LWKHSKKESTVFLTATFASNDEAIAERWACTNEGCGFANNEHENFTCQKCALPRSIMTVSCAGCRQYGHLKRNCPLLRPDLDSVRCPFCGKTGHLQPDCPKYMAQAKADSLLFHERQRAVEDWRSGGKREQEKLKQIVPEGWGDIDDDNVAGNAASGTAAAAAAAAAAGGGGGKDPGGGVGGAAATAQGSIANVRSSTPSPPAAVVGGTAGGGWSAVPPGPPDRKSSYNSLSHTSSPPVPTPANIDVSA